MKLAQNHARKPNPSSIFVDHICKYAVLVSPICKWAALKSIVFWIFHEIWVGFKKIYAFIFRNDEVIVHRSFSRFSGLLAKFFPGQHIRPRKYASHVQLVESFRLIYTLLGLARVVTKLWVISVSCNLIGCWHQRQPIRLQEKENTRNFITTRARPNYVYFHRKLSTSWTSLAYFRGLMCWPEKNFANKPLKRPKLRWTITSSF